MKEGSMKKVEKYYPSILEIILYRLAAAVIVIAGIIIIYFYYFLFFPREIIAYPKGTVFPVLNEPVKAGGYLQYQLYYCKYSNDTSTVFHTLTGKYTYTLGQVRRNIPVGCHTTIISDIFIPPTVVPGRYILYVTVEYYPNPFRTFQYLIQTKEFMVSAAPEKIIEEINNK